MASGKAVSCSRVSGWPIQEALVDIYITSALGGSFAQRQRLLSYPKGWQLEPCLVLDPIAFHSPRVVHSRLTSLFSCSIYNAHVSVSSNQFSFQKLKLSAVSDTVSCRIGLLPGTSGQICS